MAQLQWFVGVDWGSRTHHVATVREGFARNVRSRMAVRLAEMVACIADSTADAPGEQDRDAARAGRGEPAGVRPGGALDQSQATGPVPRPPPAGAKDDRRDAWVLAAALRSDADAFHQVEATDPLIVELREWSRIAEELKRERVRLSNQMREQLWRYYPQFNDTVALAKPWALDLWKRVPTPAAARGVRVTYDLLKKHRIRRFDGATLKGQLQRPWPSMRPRRASQRCRALLSKRLVVGSTSTRSSTSSARRKPTPRSQRRDRRTTRDVAILRSLPGVGPVVSATLLAEAYDALRRRDYPRCAACAAWHRSPDSPARAVSSRAPRRAPAAARHRPVGWRCHAVSPGPIPGPARSRHGQDGRLRRATRRDAAATV